MMLDILLYSGNVWLIIGLLLAILELTNGTLIFFLPTGASGLLTGLVLKMQESGSKYQYILMLVWSFDSLGNTIFHTIFSDDINDY